MVSDPTDSTDSKVQRESANENTYDPRATAWLKTRQVDQMRSAAVANSATYLAARNDAILTLLYETGLRIGELVQLDVEMLDFEDGVLMLPAEVQKDYPNDNSPVYTEIALADETIRVLRTYLAGRWKDSEALFPSRSAARITDTGRPKCGEAGGD